MTALLIASVMASWPTAGMAMVLIDNRLRGLRFRIVDFWCLLIGYATVIMLINDIDWEHLLNKELWK